MIRKAVWAGTGKFYPDKPDLLKKAIEGYLDQKSSPKDVKAVIMPHAGYVFSGAVAGKTISHAKVRDTAIILAPNHTGLGTPYSLMAKGLWQTPLGEVNIDEDFAKILLENSKFIQENEHAHINEHSIEVQIPFLQYFRPDIKIAPIVINDFILSHYKAVGEGIANAILQYSRSVLIVVSTDMTHYETHDLAKEKDKLALEAIMDLNPEELIKRVEKHKISMCGFAPVAVALYAVKALGAAQVELIDYQTSGAVSGDYSHVVGYAGLIIS